MAKKTINTETPPLRKYLLNKNIDDYYKMVTKTGTLSETYVNIDKSGNMNSMFEGIEDGLLGYIEKNEHNKPIQNYFTPKREIIEVSTSDEAFENAIKTYERSDDYLSYLEKYNYLDWVNLGLGLATGKGVGIYFNKKEFGFRPNFNITSSIMGGGIVDLITPDTPLGQGANMGLANALANRLLDNTNRNILGNLTTGYATELRNLLKGDGELEVDFTMRGGITKPSNAAGNIADWFGGLTGFDITQFEFDKQSSIFAREYTSTTEDGIFNLQAQNENLLKNTIKSTKLFLNYNLSQNLFEPKYELPGDKKEDVEKKISYDGYTDELKIKENVIFQNYDDERFLHGDRDEIYIEVKDIIDRNRELVDSVDENGVINSNLFVDNYFNPTEGLDTFQTGLDDHFRLGKGRTITVSQEHLQDAVIPTTTLATTFDENGNMITEFNTFTPTAFKISDPKKNPYHRAWLKNKKDKDGKEEVREYSLISHNRRHNTEDYINEYQDYHRINKELFLQHSVIGHQGILKISPYETIDTQKYNPKTNRFKKFMLSLENLAWKDVDFGEEGKYETGNFGGRIMWFPPYNLKFNENVSVNWNKNDFIGRGESVYTYNNTDRTGTLSFDILIDHPAILNYWKKNGTNHQSSTLEKELAIPRYFDGEQLKYEIPDKTNEEEKTERVKVSDREIVNQNRSWDLYFPNNYSLGEECVNILNEYKSITNKLYKKGNVSFSTTELKPLFEKVKTIMSDKNNKESLTYIFENYESSSFYTKSQNLSGIPIEHAIKGGDSNDTDISGITYYKDGDVAYIKNMYIEDVKYEEDVLITECPYNEYAQDSHQDHIKPFNRFDTTYFRLNENFPDIEYFINEISGKKIEFKSINIIGMHSAQVTIANSTNDNKLAKRRALAGALLLMIYGIDNVTFNLSANELTEEDMETIVVDGEILKNRNINIYSAKKERSVNISIISDEVIAEEVWKTKKWMETVVKAEGIEYYNEYDFFKVLQEHNKFNYDKVIDKIDYFEPAFHSITPEGFNSRLTFLHQCTRQGPTTINTDEKGVNNNYANNLAFGRPPICIMRVGDFFHTKILINSLTINYDDASWDFNPEGIGMQPMLAKVHINITFLGGSDLTGPISRLQNALSFNYYANTSVYDNRSDMVKVNPSYSSKNEDNQNGDSKYLIYTKIDGENIE